jgi:hypothetical protein
MQTTLVTAPVPGAPRAKTTVYVGGLADGVTEAVLHAVCIPFGEIKVRVWFEWGQGAVRGPLRRVCARAAA